MQKNSRIIAIWLTLIVISPVFADEQVPTFAELSAMQAQQIYYEMKAKRDQSRQDAAKFAAVDAIPSTAPISSEGSSIPQLRGVVGSDMNLYGTFVFSTGGTVEARTGDILPGGYRVEAIALGKSTLSKDGKRIQVARSTAGNELMTRPNPTPSGFPMQYGPTLAPSR
ncbi:type IV pilus biogenesis protein PilP [Pseudomonas sp. AB12(2023)]|uniref:type IV pilus biogenesis protein PilP n=1 Tax=Pseudomonas sp. AB12(2023) TaxID=3048597 RepID=UPI002B22CB30|nr:type IV pilus biogenesis protein PilP [Pseudomonas sp. AB12(2023)]MEB0222091.1 type IV pilus biogenesis protein PilP [Pseudomonas sp. AB12(2023)]